MTARVLSCYVAFGAAALASCTFAAAATRSVPSGTFNGCPGHILPLPGSQSAYGPTVRKVVLRFVGTTFASKTKTPKKLAGARTTGVQPVQTWLPSGWIKSECGATVWERSLAVFVYFPAMDLPHNPIGHCNACDHIAFITSRTRSGWTVWGDY